MRSGEITSVCERGEGDDAGRHRLTFFPRQCRLRVVLDDEGQVLKSPVE